MILIVATRTILKLLSRSGWVSAGRGSIHPFVLFWLLVLGAAMSGCVPMTNYEQATSAAEVEREGRRRSDAKLELATAKLERIEKERDQLAARLDEKESAVAQTAMDIVTTQKERDQQTELVTQLRGELARVGGHLEAFAGEKNGLAQELEQAKTKLEEQEGKIARLEAKLELQQAELSKLRPLAVSQTETDGELDQAMDDLSKLEDGPEADETDASADEDEGAEVRADESRDAEANGDETNAAAE